MMSEMVLSFDSTTFRFLAIAVLTAVLYLWWSRRSRTGLPPFPATPLPIIGNLLNLTGNPRRIFEKWRRQCGDVFSIYMGQDLVIVLNGYDTLKEVFVTYGDHFSDRPSIFMYEAMGAMNCGLVGSSGAVWKEQRSVSVNILKQLGMGKNVLAEKIQEEVGYFLQLLDDVREDPVDLEDAASVAFSNVVCAIVVGERSQYDDLQLRRILGNLKWVAKNVDVTNPLNVFPKLMYIPGDLFKGKETKRRMCEVVELFCERHINENKPDDSRDNFISMYLKQQRLNEERGVDTTLNKRRLAICVLDLLGAGVDTSTLTMLWFILRLIHNPKVQEKIQSEIDAKIGSNRSPTLVDRPHLPYLNAAIMEIQRISSIVPLSLPHLCSKTVNVRGYTIPKGATVAPNIDSVLYDQVTWGHDVDAFRPERHLDESGNLITRPESIPFSIGRRSCLGESVAKMELFLFTSAMLQRFSFMPEDPNNLPSVEEIYGLTRNPHPFKVKITRR